MPGVDELPPPREVVEATPRELLGQLEEALGTAPAAQVCADILEGGDPTQYEQVIRYLSGHPWSVEEHAQLGWKPYWFRTWGARGLLYVWADAVAPAVLGGLGDPHWRVAEMCVKVTAKRDLGAGGDAVARLSTHELPRVRAAAVRALGLIGDTDHVSVVESHIEDDSTDVRRSAARALDRLTERLDLPW
ncbi:MAG: HEAT repeat domain-containing protein [Nocardioidaceae bacterium]